MQELASLARPEPKAVRNGVSGGADDMKQRLCFLRAPEFLTLLEQNPGLRRTTATLRSTSRHET